MRTFPGAHPSGGLRPSHFVPDKIVRINNINSVLNFKKSCESC